MRVRVALAVTVLAAAAIAGGCTEQPSPAGPPAQAPSRPAPVYVAVGASESVGVGTDDTLREAWTQVFYREALPREAVFVNLAVPGATAEEALERQVPEGLELHPTVVTVWLNVNDLVAGVPTADYEAALAEVVGRLRQAGARVLVANTPELDGLPADQRCRDGAGCPFASRLSDPDALRRAVAAYNEAIGAVAERTGAVLVDLRAVGLAARAAGGDAALVSDDGFHPSAAGHRAVAQAFKDAYDNTDAGRAARD